MPHLPKPSDGGEFVPPPAGTFPAICYRIIDLGTQETTFQGERKEQHKVLLSWELKSDETIMDDGQPMSIHQRYTWSMHEKATLRRHLEAWRGAKFKDSDFGPGGFDVKNVLGKSCMLTIMHNESNGKTYANVASVSKLPKGMTAGELHNKTMLIWLTRDEFDRDAFDELSDGLKMTIKKSPEYNNLSRSGGGAETRAAKGGAGLDDEIPF